MTVTFTDAACNYIKKMLEKKPATFFRLSIKKTGCSGYSYFPNLVETKAVGDTLIAINGLNILIDTTWMHLLQGVEVDYIEEEKTGLKQKRLVFTNPNESSRCGCGESFHVE